MRVRRPSPYRKPQRCWLPASHPLSIAPRYSSQPPALFLVLNVTSPSQPSQYSIFAYNQSANRTGGCEEPNIMSISMVRSELRARQLASKHRMGCICDAGLAEDGGRGLVLRRRAFEMDAQRRSANPGKSGSAMITR